MENWELNGDYCVLIDIQLPLKSVHFNNQILLVSHVFNFLKKEKKSHICIIIFNDF